MNVGGAASKLMADTAVPSGPYKCLDADGVGERHMGGPLCGLTSRFSGGGKRRPLKPDVRRNALRSAAADLAPHPPLPEPILMPRPPQIRKPPPYAPPPTRRDIKIIPRPVAHYAAFMHLAPVVGQAHDALKRDRPATHLPVQI